MISVVGLPLITAGIAMLMDIRSGRVSNTWLLLMLLLGFLQRILREGWGILPSFLGGLLFPLLLLGVLFLFHMLGAGDIKLFCVLGSMTGIGTIWHCIAASFVIGGLISVLLLLEVGMWKERFRYFWTYCRDLAASGVVRPYIGNGMRTENIHFTVAIFLSVVLYAGGVL